MGELLESIYGEEILSQQSQLSVVVLVDDEDDNCDSDMELLVMIRTQRDWLGNLLNLITGRETMTMMFMPRKRKKKKELPSDAAA